MACEIVNTDGAVFVLWGQPTRPDLDHVVARVELVAQRAGHPIVFIARIPKNAPAPEGVARARMNELMPRFIRVCSSYHAVLEGTGFVSAVKRAVLTSLLQFGFRNGSFFVHDNVTAIPPSLARSDRVLAEGVLALASSKGLLSAGPPAEPASLSKSRPPRELRT